MCIYVYVCIKCIPEIFRLFQERPFLISKKYETLSSFEVGSSNFSVLILGLQPFYEGPMVGLEVGSSNFSALILGLQPFYEGPMVDLQSEDVQDSCHTLLHLQINCPLVYSSVWGTAKSQREQGLNCGEDEGQF
ncbi:Hypothetical predicted protein [Octopus vulgaris]|uniref:Uncharacterized protein n=1 Tax=Octopus vulgaris TaxID=6645 RepID=A0AA36BU77_OCTVU|nr:Hypothetical predicted protein [Octopus vulgaris]